MKELKISELMDDYVDNEVCIEGETWVDNEELKSLVMEQVKSKRKIKPLFKGLIAAAAVVGVCFAGAVVASQMSGSGSIITDIGATVNYTIDEDGSWDRLEYLGDGEDVFTLDNGRLYLKTNGEKTDITDLIDRETPYIYSYTNPENGYENYIIAGGTTEEYGFVDLTHVSTYVWLGCGENYGIPHPIGLRGFNTITVLIDFTIDRDPERLDDRYFQTIYDGYHAYDEEGNIKEGTGLAHHHDNTIRGIPSPEERDCPDAWLLNALEQIGLIGPDDYVEADDHGLDIAPDGYYEWLARQNQ